jgi:hypothetical protein
VSNNHVLTREIGNLRGFSTDSIYLRPANVADTAINIQRAPDGTLQLRRGYQCQIAKIGGMGIGTFDDPATDEIHTVCVGMDGFVYNKVTKQIFLYYDGQVLGNISDISNANPANVESIAHGLQTGAQIIIRDVDGMFEVNNNTYTITVVDADNFTLNGVDSFLFGIYVSGGYWSIAFADQRYLTFTIFTDPRFLTTNPGWSIAAWSITPWGSPSGESITCNITVNRAAQINGNQSNTNTVNVLFGHELVATDTIKFIASNGVSNQRTVLSVTPTSITFDGYPVTVLGGTYINQFFDIPFRRGFDVSSPYLIQTFIDTITNPSTGVHGLQVAINGDSNLPAAFLQIIEPIIIDSSRFFSSLGWSYAPWSTSPWGSPSSAFINKYFEMDYWYWERINFTVSPPMPGSASPIYQNSKDFENASLAAFDDVIYIANGIDFPQKYDGQTVYRAGMPLGVRPSATDNTSFISQPFTTGNNYQYATTYEQVDTRGHIVEGEISEVWNHQVTNATAAMNVQVTNLNAFGPNNWNTNGANATGSGVTVYGPDIAGFYYDFVPLNLGFTLKIGDTAYYADTTSAVISMASGGLTIILNVNAGHAVLPGDLIYFIDSSNVEHLRSVASVTPTTITITNEPVQVNPTDPTHANILSYRTGLVFGNVAIIDSNQSNINTITVEVGHSIQLNDVVEFLDSFNNVQRRNVTAISANTITVDGIPVTLSNLYLIYSLNQRSNAVNIRRLNPNAITFTTNSPISNNLRINIYRTLNNSPFGVNGELYFVAAIPNDSSGGAFQTYIDGLPDSEILIREFDDPDVAPNPPPISKYLKAFGNQLFYAGGERGNADNSDNVFFSEGNAPETVPLASNFFSVPSVDDDITGIGVSGSTVVTTKNRSLWAATGNFLTGNIEVVQIAPGTNIGCVAHATIASVGPLMYFVHTNGVYGITENQLFPTDPFGNPVPISLAIDVLFRETNFLPQTRYVFKRAVALNYTKDNQYLLFLPCEDAQSSIRTANSYSIILCYDYQEKNWFLWDNMNAAGGIFSIDDDLYFQERRFSSVDGNTANLYKQHRFYRLIDHADHAGPQRMEWKSSWEDLGQPEVRKKFCRCILLMDRLSELFQFNNPEMNFSTYLNRLPNLQNTQAKITQVDNIRNSSWSYSGWGWNYWSGYQDSFITVNLKQGTVSKSIQVGFTMQGINMDMKLAGFQLEVIPENRKSVLR